MSCTDYVFYGQCHRQNCNYVHSLLFCNKETNANCQQSHCRRFHLTPEELDVIKKNERHYLQKIQGEVDRVVYILKSCMPVSRRPNHCTGLFMGLVRCRPLAECLQCYEEENWSRNQKCTRKYLKCYIIEINNWNVGNTIDLLCYNLGNIQGGPNTVSQFRLWYTIFVNL